LVPVSLSSFAPPYPSLLTPISWGVVLPWWLSGSSALALTILPLAFGAWSLGPLVGRIGILRRSVVLLIVLRVASVVWCVAGSEHGVRYQGNAMKLPDARNDALRHRGRRALRGERRRRAHAIALWQR
jgi:hypothetical protein